MQYFEVLDTLISHLSERLNKQAMEKLTSIHKTVISTANGCTDKIASQKIKTTCHKILILKNWMRKYNYSNNPENDEKQQNKQEVATLSTVID